MCCEHLVCASCARPVAEAACPVCRGTRAQFHGPAVHGAGLGAQSSYAALALAALLLLALLMALR
jgi:hypothetical protein